MPSAPMPFDEFQDKLKASWYNQVSRGPVRFILTRGLINLSIFMAGLFAVILLRGSAYAHSRNASYFLCVTVLLILMSFGPATYNYYSIKRRVAKS